LTGVTPAAPKLRYPPPVQDKAGVPAVSTAVAPSGYAPAAVPPVRASATTTLLVEDFAPWGTDANEQVLASAGIAYDRVTSTDIAAIDLSRYRHIIVAGDQPSIFYLTLSQRSAQIDAFVSGGGVLEYHGAGWGFNAGDASLVTLPGGVATALH